MGTLSGAQLNGTFHTWHDGERERVEQNLGARTERSLQLGSRRFEQNSNGNVIEIKGLLLRRARTQDFIGSTALFDKPQYSKSLGFVKLNDGREVYQLEVSPPEGETETMSIDAHTHLLDRLEYVDGDGIFSVDFSDFRPVAGYIFSFKQVQSDGDHPYDVTQTVTQMIAGKSIPKSVFEPLVPVRLLVSRPVTVPIVERFGALYTDVVIHGRTFTFLIDSGAQGLVLDSRVSTLLGLLPQGSFEARGTSRTGGIGVTALDKIHIGDATLPVGVASILDLAGSTNGRFAIDGILGFSLFGAAMVQIDYAKMTMTIAAPGGLPALGTKFDVDTDRELPEMQGRFLIDTGNGNELLLFHAFMQAHPGLVTGTMRIADPSYGVGGASTSYSTSVGELDLGPYRLFHRTTNVILSTEGAFADRFDAGNIGLATLKNFIVTFDAFNRTLYLERGGLFSDGRERHPVNE